MKKLQLAGTIPRLLQQENPGSKIAFLFDGTTAEIVLTSSRLLG
jgi:hypothetical protein